uniref:Glycosyltransferase 61 catalytic domain-containing protein n=1 Tax=Oryza brachyantha TaxID=4533 RepID=J3KVW7_ORYBR
MKGSSGRLHALRFESQRFRLLTIVVGCFLISLTFLLSSRPDATVFSTLGPRASFEDARRPAIKTLLRSSSSAAATRDFHVDILPQQQRDARAHLQHGIDQASERTTEWVKDTVIIQESTDGGERPEEEEAAERVTADSGDDAASAVADEDNAVQTTAAVETETTTSTSTRPDHPVEEKKQRLPVKLQDGGEHALTPELRETTHNVRAMNADSVDRQPLCDFSDFRTDICDFAGDVRMAANSSEFVLVESAAVGQPASHKEVGFEVVVNESDVANDIGQVGRLINSCDVLLGVHGAGLTNMMFLPPGATMVQVVPWGGLQWIARMDYGEPAEAMGFKYIQYEIAVPESSLKDKYPAGDEIFTNPTGLHKRGFMFMKQTLMDGQDITIDISRFRPVLQQALDNLAN